jgi:hypothetical protein
MVFIKLICVVKDSWKFQGLQYIDHAAKAFPKNNQMITRTENEHD